MNKYKVKICDKEVEIKKNRATAIKAYCMDCSSGQIGEIKSCPRTTCPLYIYRGYIQLGKKKVVSPEERERFIKMRAEKMGQL